MASEVSFGHNTTLLIEYSNVISYVLQRLPVFPALAKQINTETGYSPVECDDRYIERRCLHTVGNLVPTATDLEYESLN